MDNKVFDVNGSSKAKLLMTLKLALSDEDGKEQIVNAWRFDPDYGLVLCWCHDEGNTTKFPVALNADSLIDMVWGWLSTKEAKEMRFEGLDADADHDGDNEMGFRVYRGDWNLVGKNRYGNIAVRPSYLWYGK